MLECHRGAVLSVSVTPNGWRVVSGSSDKTVRIWDLNSGTCCQVLEGHTACVRAVARHPDSKRMVSAGGEYGVPQARRGCNLKVWDSTTGECLLTLNEHDAMVNTVAFHSDGCRLVSGSSDKTIRIWDLATGTCLRTINGHASDVWAVALHSECRWVASVSKDNTLRVWELDTGRCITAWHVKEP